PPPPLPTATRVSVDETELRALREAGHQWSTFPRATDTHDGIDPDLGVHEQAGSHLGDKRVRVRRSRRSGLEMIDTGYLRTVAPRVAVPKSGIRRVAYK